MPQLSRARARVKRPQAWSRRAKVSGIAAQPSAAPGRGPGPVPCREARRKPLWWRAWAPKSLVALAGTSAAARAGSGCACQLPCPLERVLPVSAKSWFGPSSSRGRAWPRAPGAFRVGLGRLSHGHVLTARMSTRGPILQCHVAACKKTQKTDRRLMRMLSARRPAHMD